MKNPKLMLSTIWGIICCVSAGTRTLDPLIKSQLLYQLSYGDIAVSLSLNCDAKVRTIFETTKFFFNFFHWM